MERYKKDTRKIIATLIRANEAIEKNIDQNLGMDLMDMLIQCQETAIILGTHLETLGESGRSAVQILEDYCENIYQLSIGSSDEYRHRKLVKKIRRQLARLDFEVRFSLPEDKKEIVFLPYKAAMWDSLESIWMAAAEDENCEAYVIPIPYFDRNPDGTFGAMHYEGKEYPEYVPVTDWETYRFEERSPDVIYIHNPYDQYNYVTSVHPAFYAKELKKYTENLVYVPYFVAVNDKVDSHLCVMPGILYADKVIVQSENVRKTYLEELHKFEDENNCKNSFGNIENKILALGSPKYDKALHTRRQDLNIPKEWQNIICRPDGTFKKIILYNTSIAALLEHSDRMLAKIADVISFFRRVQEDVALLWRPHPLIPATLQSLRPLLWKQYSGMADGYRREGWGIYDDTSNMDRALTLSDAYYGDGGSLLELYRQTGKPIMLQNVEAFYKEDGKES